MAAIAPSDPYSIFIRKIGWSVGLENTFSRVNDLVRLYVTEKEISPQGWSHLLRDKTTGWGLSTDHIADFFTALQLVKVEKKEIHILPCLDALALARLELADDSQFSDAFKFILGSQLILADGDIFLNFLAGGFSREKVEPLLRGMILGKRDKLLGSIKSPQLVERVIRSVAIDTQPTNTGGAAAGKTLSEMKRTAPLGQRTAPLTSRVNVHKVEISDDYFRKVTGRRKDWARSLGLVDSDTNLTSVGNSLLSCIRALNCTNAGPIICWPITHELERIHLLPEKLSIPRLSLWDHICAVRKGLAYDVAGINASSQTDQEVRELLKNMYAFYRSQCPKRELLRREIPIGVFFHAAVGCYIAKRRPLPNLPDQILRLSSDGSGYVTYRSSKHFEATISISK